jgi:lipopolysaccharide heptosyltransferase I
MDDFLIIRLSSLGDIIHTLPAFSSLRRHFPEARIRWAVEGRGREILDLVPGIDEVIVIDRKNWLRSSAPLRRRDQTALDFQGLVKSGLLTYLSRSRRRIGFRRKNCREALASVFYTERPGFVREDEIHIIAKNLRLLSCLGIEESRFDFPLAIPTEIRRVAEGKLQAIGYDRGKRLLLLNVGAAWETKRWFSEKWTALVEKIRFEDAFPVLLWGTGEEKRLAEAIREKTGIPEAPFLTIPEVMAAIQSASLLVSGDTFALQAAAALSVPVVGLFGPTNPRRNGPFHPRDKVIFYKLECSPCYKRSCPTLDCLQAIGIEETASAVKELWTGHE